MLTKLTISGLFAVALSAQTTYQVGAVPFTTYGAVDGCPVIQTVAGNPNTAWWYVSGSGSSAATPYEGSLRFGVTGEGGAGSITISALTYSSGEALALFRDPTLTSDGTLLQTSGALANDGIFRAVTFTGLDPNRSYEILSYLLPVNGILATGIASITITGGTLTTTPTVARPCLAMYGDSIVAYSYVSTLGAVDVRTGYYPAARGAGLSMQRIGVGGQKVVTGGIASTAQVTSATPVLPRIVLHEMGVNDQQAYVDSGSITTFQAGVVSELQNMAAGIPAGSKMLWQQILPNVAAQSAQRGPYNEAIIAGTATYNGAPVNGVTTCTYNTDGWINTTTDSAGDGLHPITGNAPDATHPFGSPLIGYGKIANRMSFLLAGYGTQAASFTISGPASGVAGMESDTFTIAPAVSGAVFNGEPITLSDGGAGGTFTPNLTTLTAGAASLTFTYTPASSGTKAISASGLADCWTAPVANSYDAQSDGPNNTRGILIGRK